VRLVKPIKIALLALLACAVAAAGVLYLLAGAVPQGYRPAQLGGGDRVQAAKHFYGKVMDFDGQAQGTEAFDLSVTQEELNNYLASVDEIAALLPEGHSGDVEGLMAAAGLCDPAVALGDGAVTFMVRSARHDNRILSADVAFRFGPDGRLRVRLGQMRIGELAVPEEVVHRRLQQVRDMLAGRDSGGQSRQRTAEWINSAGAVAAVAEAAITAITAAIDGEAIVPEGAWRQGRIRVEGVEVTPDQLHLRLRPVGRKTHPTASHR
jgi:hypothetical protein